MSYDSIDEIRKSLEMELMRIDTELTVNLNDLERPDDIEQCEIEFRIADTKKEWACEQARARVEGVINYERDQALRNVNRFFDAKLDKALERVGLKS